jgi:hypothetical protein
MLVISIGALSETGLAQSSKPDVQIQVQRQNQKKPFQLALSFPQPCEYPDETHSFPYSSVCGWEAELAYQVGYSYEDGDIHTSFNTVAGQTCDAWMTANANQDSKPIVEDLGSYFPFTPPWQRRGLYRGKAYKDFTGTQRLQIQAYGCLPLDGEIVIAASWGNIIGGSHAIARLGWMYKQAATAFTEQAKGLPVKVAEFRPTTPAPETAPLQATVQAAAEPATAPVKQAPVPPAPVQAKSAPAPAAAQTLAKAAAAPVAPASTEAAGSSSSTPAAPPVAPKPSGAYFNPSAHALILPTKSGDISMGVPADMTVVKVETPKPDVTTIGLTSSAGNVQLFLIDVPNCSSWNEQNRKVKEGRVIPRESGLLDQRWFSPAYFDYITQLNEQDLEACLDRSGGGLRMIIRDFRNILRSDITQFSVNIASAFPGTAAPSSQASTSVDSAIPLFLLNAARQCKQGMNMACELVASIQPIMANCNRGQDAIDGQECYSIAEMASSSKDREAAQTYYKRACELGYKKACKKAK